MVVKVVQTFESPIASLIDADTSLFFITQEQQLGVSDGTTTGTLILNSDGDGEDYEGLNGQIFFDGFTSATGEEPFVNSGTPESTTLLRDINPIPNETSDPLNFTSVGDIVFFTANDGENGVALWSSDGTSEGTRLIADISSREDSLAPFDELFNLNDTLFFFGDDGENADGLWTSDGTTEGTQLISNLPGSSSNYFNLTGDEENLYFVGSFGEELWTSDGTSEGTQQILFADNTSFFGSGENALVSIGNNVYFTADDEATGEELWISDGTSEGTRLVIDIQPETRTQGQPINQGSNPQNLTNVNGTLYFTADDGANGEELWASDGTPEGTRMLTDINSETTLSSSYVFSDFTPVGDKLYFVYDNFLDLSGSQLWQSDGTTEGTFPVEPDEIPTGVGDNTTPSFTIDQLTEFDEQLYFTGTTYDTEIETYIPALLIVEDVEETIVYRSFNPTVGVHFYTTDITERDEFLATGNYVDEGASYRAAGAAVEEAEEVYRFFNADTGVHLYTTNESERDFIQTNLNDFEFEGVVFNAFETQVDGTIPIYRFFEPTIGVHLYTPNEAEKEFVETSLPNYNFEGIAYYALPLETDTSS